MPTSQLQFFAKNLMNIPTYTTPAIPRHSGSSSLWVCDPFTPEVLRQQKSEKEPIFLKSPLGTQNPIKL